MTFFELMTMQMLNKRASVAYLVDLFRILTIGPLRPKLTLHYKVLKNAANNTSGHCIGPSSFQKIMKMTCFFENTIFENFSYGKHIIF